jgi:predicted O-methyltransferase YrrM
MADTRAIGLQNWCWPPVGALLRVMAALKPGGRLLEIGTGTGVGTCWLLDGMDASARLFTIDINPKVQAIARSHRRGGDTARVAEFVRPHLRRWRGRQACAAGRGARFAAPGRDLYLR